ncbi:hypothetical protein [Dyadobacter sp. MSC1_007]|jgi:nitrogen-specific signal transduction histidine kinase|uniref:hypothetical protein n=1 Tax=Dyadobacter sp. MSC1_007 TaxID=2909264 RepID=UPI002030F83A|nr:hypothetical protein [Dyadobacter sp. MSC1_007]
MEKLIENLLVAKNEDEYKLANQAIQAYFSKATEEERQQLRDVVMQEANGLLLKSAQTRQKAAELIAEFENSNINIEIDGKKYPLSEWVTLKEYCRRFGLKNTMIVNNWISRNIIPKENILNISQLNNLRLIKAVPYKS